MCPECDETHPAEDCELYAIAEGWAALFKANGIQPDPIEASVRRMKELIREGHGNMYRVTITKNK